jgi:hypothetical protein
MITPAAKMKQEVEKHIRYWQTEFELDKWQVAGVLAELTMDVLMIVEIDDDDEDDDI